MSYRSVRIDGRPVVFRMEATVSAADVRNATQLTAALRAIAQEPVANLTHKAPATSVLAHARDAVKLYRLCVSHVFKCVTDQLPDGGHEEAATNHRHRHDDLLVYVLEHGWVSFLARIATRSLLAAQTIVAALRKRRGVRISEVQHVADALLSTTRGALDVLRALAMRLTPAADQLAHSGLISWITQHASNRASLLHGYAMDCLLRLVPLGDESAVMALQLDQSLWYLVDNCDATFAMQAEVYFVFRMLHRWLEATKPDDMPCRLTPLLRLLLRLLHRGTRGGKQILEFVLSDVLLGHMLSHEAVTAMLKVAPAADLLQQLSNRVHAANQDGGGAASKWAVQQVLLVRDSLPALTAPMLGGETDSMFDCAHWVGCSSSTSSCSTATED